MIEKKNVYIKQMSNKQMSDKQIETSRLKCPRYEYICKHQSSGKCLDTFEVKHNKAYRCDMTRDRCTRSENVIDSGKCSLADALVNTDKMCSLVKNDIRKLSSNHKDELSGIKKNHSYQTKALKGDINKVINALKGFSDDVDNLSSSIRDIQDETSSMGENHQSRYHKNESDPEIARIDEIIRKYGSHGKHDKHDKHDKRGHHNKHADHDKHNKHADHDKHGDQFADKAQVKQAIKDVVA